MLCGIRWSGASGDLVQSLLRERLGDVAAQALTVRPTNSDLRTCTSIVGSEDTTELVEPSGVISEADMTTFLEQLSSTKDSVVAGMVIMGTMPPGCPDDTYAQIYQRVAGPSTLCLVDSVTGTDSLLTTIAEFTKKGENPPMVFKVNASELCKLAGVKKSSKSETGGVVLEELQDAIRQFMFEKYAPCAIPAIAALAITDGAHPGYLCTIENKKGENCELNLFRLPVPSLTTTSSDLEESPKTLYPIGAGDSVAAGTLAAWHCLNEPETKDILPASVQEALTTRYNSYLEAFKDHKGAGVLVTAFAFGLACGSASE
jgi:fructose-1-phosphate kinase PfkB-like protein